MQLICSRTIQSTTWNWGPQWGGSEFWELSSLLLTICSRNFKWNSFIRILWQRVDRATFSVTNSEVLVSISPLSKQISQRNSPTSKSRARRNYLFIPLCWPDGCPIENCHVKALTARNFSTRGGSNPFFWGHTYDVATQCVNKGAESLPDWTESVHFHTFGLSKAHILTLYYFQTFRRLHFIMSQLSFFCPLIWLQSHNLLAHWICVVFKKIGHFVLDCIGHNLCCVVLDWGVLSHSAVIILYMVWCAADIPHIVILD